ncbi:MAG: glycosyltransferase [Candidatus Omnitrophota bacterium]
MNISVIMPTWNNSERLKKTLRGFCRLDTGDIGGWEMIVVDNNSVDNTRNVVKSFTSLIPVTYKYEPRQGNSIARNTGIRLASGQLLIFVDDDVTVGENFLDAYRSGYMEHGDRYFYGGPVLSDFEGSGPPECVRPYLPKSIGGFDLGDREQVFNSKNYLIGANWGAPRMKIIEAGLFNEGLGLGEDGKVSGIGEETDLMGRLISLGLKGCYLPRAKVFHFVPAAKYSFKHILKRKERIGFYAGMDEKKSLGYPLLFGAPRWVFGELLRKGLTLVAFWRADAMKNLIEMAFLAGFLKGWLRDGKAGDNEGIDFNSDVQTR